MGSKRLFGHLMIGGYLLGSPLAWPAQPSDPLVSSPDVISVVFQNNSQELIFPSDLERASGAEFERLVGNIVAVSDPAHVSTSERNLRFLLFALEQRDRNGKRKISPQKFLNLIQQNRSRFYRDKKIDHAEELEIAARFASLDPIYRYMSCTATANRNAPSSLISKAKYLLKPDRDKKFILLTQELLKTANYDNYLDSQQRNRLLAEDTETQQREASLACKQAYDTGRALAAKNLSEPALRFITRDSAASAAK